MKVRILTFRKCFKHIGHKNRWWATLGHMDEMECSKLEHVKLENIYAFNDDVYKQDSEDAYHHVVYLIDSEKLESGQATDEEMWDSGMVKTDYLSVIRIHFPDSINLKEQFNQMNEHFRCFSLQEEYTEIVWKTYYTLELSDMIVVSRFKKLQALSRWTLLVTECALVGSAYTYFCIPGDILKNEEEPFAGGEEEDCLDFMSIRFSFQNEYLEEDVSKNGVFLEDVSKVRDCLGEIYTDPPFRITGNEDIIICARNIPAVNLIKLYWKWYRNDEVFGTFRNIISRVGTVPVENKTGSNRREKQKLEECGKQVLEKVRKKVLHAADDMELLLKDREWVRPLVELTNALVHMSRSETLDGPVFMILPGINAFWDNVVNKSGGLSAEPLYLRFAELCIHTMEHLMRAEGQLSQRPEVRPLTYDIPVFVLEYATAFLLVLSADLTEPDDERAKNIYFLLAPSAETDVSALELFRAVDRVPGLLQITVPFSILYKPKLLLGALSHELAHYVGEKYRMREQRYYYFLSCVAIEITRYLFDDITGDVTEFLNYLVREFLDSNLRENMLLEEQTDDMAIIRLSLKELADKIKRILEEVKKEDAYALLIRDFLLEGKAGNMSLYSIPEKRRLELIFSLGLRIDDLSVSFREIYADICMLYFLELTPSDYLDVVMLQPGVNTCTYLRIYISLFVTGHGMDEILETLALWWKQSRLDNGMERDRAREEIETIKKLIDDKNGSSEKYLAEYIKVCWESLQKRDSEPGRELDKCCYYTVKDIYDKILELNDDSGNYEDILDIIDMGRKKILGQMKKALGVER